MVRLNKIGPVLARQAYVHAMTDVTGFGLLGHLGEMCEASGTHARVRLEDVPLIDADILDYYLDAGSIPGGTKRNFTSYGSQVQLPSDRAKWLLADPQTSGGLLVAVDPDHASEFEALCAGEGHPVSPLGKMVPRGSDKRIEVV